MDIYDKYKNNELVKSLDDNFDVKLDEYKVYDQGNSLACWVYAAFSTIKKEVSTSLNIEMKEFDFSVNYILFYDRIEKLNRIYDAIINHHYEVSTLKYLLFNYVNTCGDFKSFKYLVKKYGIVFEHQMPMNPNSYEPRDIDDLLKQKIILDIEEMISKKNSNQDLLKLKEKYMAENYKILTDIYGELPKSTIIKDIELPIKEFYDKYVRNIVDNYVSLCCLNNLEYGKSYDINFLDMKIDDEKYLNLDLMSIKQAIIKSLNDKHPVWFGCSFRYMSSSYKNTDGILDDRLYKFDEMGIVKLPKTIAEKYNMLDYSHAMVFTGYDQKNDTIKWQVLNTFGKQHNREGYFIMSDNFFCSSVFMFAMNKKYLNL